ncbi:RusA family crossover junction endodeoxyribonuclease [Neisseria cinerea]|uniref:hypothetical protein n=1 Tax=Neisseria cinerea TaxID=483 RepID=UPI002B1CEAAB|nr:hypothetical protein [Neisseria cinerea]
MCTGDRAKIFAAAKNEAYLLAVGAVLRGFLGRKIRIVFTPPDRRSRDLDNLNASMKSALD